MPPFTPLLIHGQHRPASTNKTFEVKNPYSGEIVGTAASASHEDCIAAVESAGEAFKTWEHTSIVKKREIFLRAAELVTTDKYKRLIHQSTAEETAAADYWGTFNWIGASNSLRTHAGFVTDLKGDTFPSSSVPGATVTTVRRAMGVMCVLKTFLIASHAAATIP